MNIVDCVLNLALIQRMIRFALSLKRDTYSPIRKLHISQNLDREHVDTTFRNGGDLHLDDVIMLSAAILSIHGSSVRILVALLRKL